jgi:aspartate aminotransferase
MKLKSTLMDRVPTSTTLGMAEVARRLEARGVKVIHFELGEPDFTTPPNIIEAAYRYMKEGKTHYTSSRGIPQLCEAIARHEEKFGIHADPAKNIIVTPGSKFAIYALLRAVIDPGDEVIVISPAWPSYADMVRIVGGIPVPVKLDNSLHLDEEGLKRAITERTRLLMVNSPNTPTGGILDIRDLSLIRDLAVESDILVMSDEIYKMMVYDGSKHLSVASLPGMAERTVVVDGFSKTYAMTGWRLGYAVGDERIIDNMVKIQQNTTTCPASFAQFAAVEALSGPQDFVERMVEEYARRRRIILDLVRDIPGINCAEPKGAFYIFPDVSGLGISDAEAARGLLEAGVAVTPGSPFGPGGEGHIRVSYATGLDDILEGVRRMRSFFESA